MIPSGPLELDFMRNAFVAGGCIALSAGLVGYFLVLRNQVFSTDALGHVAFTGGLGALLAGLDLLVGVYGGCLAAALAIGAFGGRERGRDVATGTFFAWVLGVGVLFLSLYTTSKSAGGGAVAGISILFGSILSLQPGQVAAAIAVPLATAAITLAMSRPMLFASIDPEVAQARGLPTRALAVVLLLLVAVTVAEAVQAVGALLILALMVTPAAAAQNLTSRPWLALLISPLLAVAIVWAGLLASFYMSYPVTFFVTAFAFAAYAVSAVVSALGQTHGQVVDHQGQRGDQRRQHP